MRIRLRCTGASGVFGAPQDLALGAGALIFRRILERAKGQHSAWLSASQALGVLLHSTVRKCGVFFHTTPCKGVGRRVQALALCLPCSCYFRWFTHASYYVCGRIRFAPPPAVPGCFCVARRLCWRILPSAQLSPWPLWLRCLLFGRGLCSRLHGCHIRTAFFIAHWFWAPTRTTAYLGTAIACVGKSRN